MDGKKVLLGVSGCIAAYKSCEIVRSLQKAGVEVRVVMTQSATEFVGATTFDALCGHPAAVETFGNPENPIPHIEMAKWCDLFLVAPCTANVLAKIAHGIADDLLTTAALAAHDKLMVAPAMNDHMYEAPATQENLNTLRKYGVAVVDATSGLLACGDTGKGKLAAVETITDEALGWLRMSPGGKESSKGVLGGKRVLVTGGPTIERIDPVRYITNGSSGKMAYAVAREASRRGASVTLVSGPTNLPEIPGVETVRVESANEMMNAAEAAFSASDIAVFAAAVCDHRPSSQSPVKLKKGKDEEGLTDIKMVENPDILATLAQKKRPDQYVVGFAAETEHVIANARIKLAAKGADMIVANEVGGGLGFKADDNKASLVFENRVVELPVMPKSELARKILDEACANIA